MDTLAPPKSQGFVTLEPKSKRLVFVPEVYPVGQIADDGWHHDPDDSWSAPYSVGRLRKLQERFPHITTGVELRHWDTPLVPATGVRPAVYHRLYHHQQVAVEWLLQRRSGLLGLSPGLGKTATALVALQTAGVRQTLVVCPKTLCAVWEREAGLWWPEAVVHQAFCPTSVDRTTPRLFVLTYDRFRIAQRRGEIGYVQALVFDESVLLKTHDSRLVPVPGAHRKRRIFRVARVDAAYRARQNADLCWMLSGSPTTRFYDDLWAQLHIMEPKEYTSYWRFAGQYCIPRTTVWGTAVAANRPNADIALRRDLRDVFHQYGYLDLARDEPDRAIPEWIVETREVTLPDKWWKIYKQMQDQFRADLPSGETILAPTALVKALRLLQLASNPGLLEEAPPPLVQDEWITGGKVAAALELFEELPQPMIYWTAFIRTANVLGHALRAPVLHGDTPEDERARIVAQFQAGELPALVAHPAVGKYGLTMTAGRSAIYVERSYSGDDYLQSLYRVRRIGTVEPPHIVHLLATGPRGQRTVDHIVDRVLSYRATSATALTTSLIKEVLND